MEKDKVAQEEIHRIRITLVSTNVKAVEKSKLYSYENANFIACADIKRIAVEKQVKVSEDEVVLDLFDGEGDEWEWKKTFREKKTT